MFGALWHITSFVPHILFLDFLLFLSCNIKQVRLNSNRITHISRFFSLLFEIIIFYSIINYFSEQKKLIEIVEKQKQDKIGYVFHIFLRLVWKFNCFYQKLEFTHHHDQHVAFILSFFHVNIYIYM